MEARLKKICARTRPAYRIGSHVYQPPMSLWSKRMLFNIKLNNLFKNKIKSYFNILKYNY